MVSAVYETMHRATDEALVSWGWGVECKPTSSGAFSLTFSRPSWRTPEHVVGGDADSRPQALHLIVACDGYEVDDRDLVNWGGNELLLEDSAELFNPNREAGRTCLTDEDEQVDVGAFTG